MALGSRIFLSGPTRVVTVRVWTEQGEMHLWVRPLGRCQGRSASTASAGGFPTWAPLGSRRYGEKVVDALGEGGGAT